MSERDTVSPEISLTTRRRFIEFAKNRANTEVEAAVAGTKRFEGRASVESAGQLVGVTALHYVYVDGPSEEASVEFLAPCEGKDIAVDGLLVPAEGPCWYSAGARDCTETTADSEVIERLDAIEQLEQSGAITLSN
jgi:hypothetical protein